MGLDEKKKKVIFYPTLSSIQSINTHTIAAMEVGYSDLLQTT